MGSGKLGDPLLRAARVWACAPRRDCLTPENLLEHTGPADRHVGRPRVPVIVHDGRVTIDR